MAIRHFLRDDDLTPAEQSEVLALAAAFCECTHDHEVLEHRHAAERLRDLK